MKEDYLIKNPSEILVLDALVNLPVEPESIYLYFNANGIKIPHEPEDNELEKYLITCKEKKIIPFSTQEIDYTREISKRVKEQELFMKTFFQNGRANEILINLKEKDNLNISDIFNRIISPALLINHYKVSQGNITLSSNYSTDFEGGGMHPVGNASLYLNWSGYNGLKLNLNQDSEEVKNNNYAQWFENLKKKYKIID